MKKFNLSKINSIALSLFGVVLSQKSFESTKSVERNLSKETKLFSDYNVIIVPQARYAIEEIYSHIVKTKKTAKQLNATFYRAWNDVLSKTRFELLFDQIMHYSTTYGTNFEGEVYVPASYEEIELDSKESKLPVSFVNALSEADIAEKAVSLLSSGVALKQETVEELLELLSELSLLVKNAHKITNKEAKIIVADKYGLVNVFNQSDFIRFLVFKATGKTLLIKNKGSIDEIIASKIDVSDLLTSYGVSKIAESFNRYKPLYLAFKKANKKNVVLINKISKLSKTLHKPMKENPLNRISQDILTKEDIEFIEDSSLPTLIRAYNAALLKSEHSDYSSFIVRNGKSWVNEERNEVNSQSLRVARINAEILKGLIVEKIGKEFVGKKFYIPKEIEYGLPLSEKQMCGNIPNNTIITTKDNMFVGVYWNEGYDVTDLDLSGISTSGQKYGWNSDYYSRNGGIAYSGDMTSPGKDGATEYLMVRDTVEEDGVEIVDVTVNGFRSEEEYKFDIIVGLSDQDDIGKKAMMTPSSLTFAGERKTTSRGNSLGLIVIQGDTKKFVFSPSETSNLRVSRNNEARQVATNGSMIHKINHSLTLNKFIELLGGEVVHEREEEVVDLSPQKITKDFFNLIF